MMAFIGAGSAKVVGWKQGRQLVCDQKVARRRNSVVRRQTESMVLFVAETTVAPATELYGSIFAFSGGLVVFTFAAALFVGFLASRNPEAIIDQWAEGAIDSDDATKEMLAKMESQVAERKSRRTKDEASDSPADESN